MGDGDTFAFEVKDGNYPSCAPCSIEATVMGDHINILADDLSACGTSISFDVPRYEAAEFGAWLVAQAAK